MFLVAANTRQAIVGQKEWITTGSSGIQVQFLFSDDWEGLSKFAVFRNAEIEESKIPIALTESNLTELPAENCAAEYVDEKVYVGVYGSDGLGHIIIPTIWVSLGVLKEGAAYEGMDPPQPTPDMWAQILAIAQSAGAENAEAAEKAEAGAKEAASTAQAAAAEVKNLSVDADTLAAGEPATVEKTVDAETGAVKLKFGIPQGPKGNPMTYEDMTEEQKEELVQGPILDAQNAAVTAIGNARVNAVNAVGSAGTTAVDAVNQAGTTQVGNVNQAGTTQVQAVADKGDEVIGSIPPDYSDLAAEVGDLNRHLSDLEYTVSTTQIINSASGAIASFDDGADSMPVRKLVAQIEPVQDLHGYDSPWPAGGNVNKLPPAESFAPVTAGNSTITPYPDGHYHLSKTAGSDSDLILINLATPIAVTTNQYINYIASGGTGSMVANLKGDSGTLNGGYWSKPSANIANNGTAKSWEFYFTAGVAGEFDLWPIISDAPVSEFTPYSNLCPISGHTGAEIEQTGKNLLAKPFVYRTQAAETIQDCFFIKKGQYVISGTFSAENRVLIRLLDLEGNLLGDSSHCPNTFYYWNSNTHLWNGSGNQTVPKTPINIVEDCYIRFLYGVDGVTINNAQLELGSTATDYEPYTGNQISVTFPTTIYGGEDEVISGKLKSTMGIVDLGTLSWRTITSGGKTFFVASNSDIKPAATSRTVPNILCECYKTVSLYDAIYTAVDSVITLNDNTTDVLRVLDSRFANVTDFVSAITGQKLCYELAEPIEYTTEPQTLDTFYGTNNIWSNTGDTEVTYPADTRLFIEQLTKPTEDDMIADHAISAGTFFQLGNTLYLATSQIAAGGTITPGTNATKLSLADALNTLNS